MRSATSFSSGDGPRSVALPLLERRALVGRWVRVVVEAVMKEAARGRMSGYREERPAAISQVRWC
jgi:hypothetical protein